MGTRSANEKANNNFAGIYGGTGGPNPWRELTTRRINYDPAREADLGHVLLV